MLDFLIAHPLARYDPVKKDFYHLGLLQIFDDSEADTAKSRKRYLLKKVHHFLRPE